MPSLHHVQNDNLLWIIALAKDPSPHVPFGLKRPEDLLCFFIEAGSNVIGDRHDIGKLSLTSDNILQFQSTREH